MKPAPFATRLLHWFAQNRRDLPWRRTRDPWAIWVSEIMLQQTRVEAVRATYVRFMARYPTPAHFAAVDDDELHSAWRGLGYYRRARMLRDGAQKVESDHSGLVPGTVEQLAELPGIGPYTLGAVGSIAFGLRLPAIDGNVERVVARHRLLGAPVAAAATRQAIREHVERWLAGAPPGDFNQALMELGATVCVPHSPGCDRCPVAADCAGRRAGVAGQLPVRPPRKPLVTINSRVVVVAVGGRFMGQRVPEGEPNSGQFELPGAGILQSVEEHDLPRAVRGRHGARIRIGPILARVRHTITHHRIHLIAHAGVALAHGGLEPRLPDDPSVPWTTASRKVFERLLRPGRHEA